MRETLERLAEQAELALGSSRGVIAEERLVPLSAAVSAVRARLAYPEEVAVVALAGGTGSGKSSLFNAMVGEEAAETGGIRPTTEAPLAAVPTVHVEPVGRYLELIGVQRWLPYADPRVCLIDLPDTDSVETGHRHRVDAMLGRVDLVVWVVDPEKYRDARLHHDYLRPLSPYSGQFLFVLNQVDRLHEEEVGAVVGDLVQALSADGIVDPVVVPLAAAPRAGPPLGVDRLREAITSRLESGSAIHDKLLVDLETTARSLAGEADRGLDFDRRAAVAVAEASARLAAGDDRSATAVLRDFLDAIAAEAGGETARRVRHLAAQIPSHVLRIAADTAASRPPKRRAWRRRRPGPEPTQFEGPLTEAVVRPVRALLAKRALVVADIAALAVEVARARSEGAGLT